MREEERGREEEREEVERAQRALQPTTRSHLRVLPLEGALIVVAGCAQERKCA